MSEKKSDKRPKKNTKSDKKMQELEQRISELTEDLQRVQADFINYRNRNEEANTQSVEIGKQAVVRELLPVIDNIERALTNVPDDLADHGYIEGVQKVAKQLQDKLASLGVQKIVAIDQEFDPELMEAVSMEDEGGENEVVVEEMQSGYQMNGYVIRHAMVKVKRS